MIQIFASQIFHLKVKQKIKLNIGDRIYPLTVQRSQEFYFREAAKIIEKTIKNLYKKYGEVDINTSFLPVY